MCGGGYSGDKDPAKALSELLQSNLDAKELRHIIRTKWTSLTMLAHAVHDQEISEEAALNRAIENIAALSTEGLSNLVKGNVCASLREDFDLIAKKAGYSR